MTETQDFNPDEIHTKGPNSASEPSELKTQKQIAVEIAGLQFELESGWSLAERALSEFPPDALLIDVKANHLAAAIKVLARNLCIARGGTRRANVETPAELEEISRALDPVRYHGSFPLEDVIAAEMYKLIEGIDSLEEAREKLHAYVTEQTAGTKRKIAELGGVTPSA